MSSEDSLFSKSQRQIDSEEIIFYIDLLTENLKKKNLIKGIKDFIEEKNTYTTPCTYGLVIFQGKSNPITIYDKTEAIDIIEVLKNSWETRETKRSFFENGLFEILSHIFKKSQTTTKLFRVITITDTPSNRSEDYQSALYDLIVKSKNFSTSIDIIRIGDEQFYSDDVKLKVISSELQGGIFYSEPKRFLDIIGSLIKNKNQFNIIKTEEDDQILEKDKTFYEKLAVELISLDPGEEEKCNVCDQDLCPICEAYSDEVRKCFNCGLKLHNCCAALYSINNHIGFLHLFRCPQCETLLKLDEDFVKMIYKEERGEEFVEEEVNVQLPTDFNQPIQESSSGKYSYESFDDQENDINKDDINEDVKDISQETEIKEQEKEGPPISLVPPPKLTPPATIAAQLPPAPPSAPSPPEFTRKVKIGGFFGGEIEVKTKKDPNTVITSTSEPVPPPESDKPLSITALKPPKRRSSIKFCKICGASVSGTATCPNCGNRVLD